MIGWLTTEAPTETVCRRFSIPDELLPLFMGALDPLLEARNYEQFGTLTPDEMVEAFQEVLDTYTTTDGECSMVGEIIMYVGTTPPPGTLKCEGAGFLIADYPALAAKLLGDDEAGQYDNGDGLNFIVPDMRGRFPLGAHGNTDNGLINAAVGDYGGEAYVQLSTSEMPAHTHSVVDPGTLNAQAGAGALPLSDPGAPTVTGSTGGGDAHNNMPPYHGVRYAIRYQ